MTQWELIAKRLSEALTSHNSEKENTASSNEVSDTIVDNKQQEEK